MDREDIEGTIERAKTLCVQGEYKKTIEIFRVLRESSIGYEHTRWVNAFEGFALFGICEYDEAMRLWNRALDLKRVHDFVNPIAFFGMALFMEHHNQDIRSKDVAEDYALFAIQMFLDLPDGRQKEWIAEFVIPHIIKCGVAFIQSGNRAGAVRILERAIFVSEWLEASDDSVIRKSDVFYRAEIGYWYATALNKQGRHSEAREELFERVLPRCRKTGILRDIARVLSKIGLTYEEERNYFMALDWYKGCLNEWVKVEDDVQIRRVQQDVNRMSELSAKEKDGQFQLCHPKCPKSI